MKFYIPIILIGLATAQYCGDYDYDYDNCGCCIYNGYEYECRSHGYCMRYVIIMLSIWAFFCISFIALVVSSRRKVAMRMEQINKKAAAARHEDQTRNYNPQQGSRPTPQVVEMTVENTNRSDQIIIEG